MAGYGAGLVVGLCVGLGALGVLSVMARGPSPEVGVAEAPAAEGASLTGAVSADPAPEVSSSRQPVGD